MLQGLQKTELCEGLHEYLSDMYDVHHFNTNSLPEDMRRGHAYWQQAAQLACAPSAAGLPTVVLAHKNLINSPPGAAPLPAHLLAHDSLC